MRYLLDTNVVSERVRPRPDPAVVAWLEAVGPSAHLLSVVTIGEIQKGVLNLGAGARKQRLAEWLEEITTRQPDRVLPVDLPVARMWGRVADHGRRTGREVDAEDGLILATAAVHGLVVVTRNERDFRGRGVDVLNPWSG